MRIEPEMTRNYRNNSIYLRRSLRREDSSGDWSLSVCPASPHTLPAAASRQGEHGTDQGTNMALDFQFDVRIPAVLIEQMMQGEITCAMLVTMTILYKWSNWNTGRVRRVCASSLQLASQKAYSERTFQDSLKRLEEMGWITRYMTRGSHKWYPVTIHNYKVVDDAGKIHILNPHEIRSSMQMEQASCGETSSEASPDTSEETSGEPSDEGSDRHESSLKSELQSSNQSEHKSDDDHSKKESKHESPSLAPLATAPTAPAEEQEQPLMGLLAEPENPKALELLGAISPNLSPRKMEEYLPVAAAILDALPKHVEATELLRWNRSHRGGKFASKDDKALRIRTAPQFLAALASEDAYLLNGYETHDFGACEICRDRNHRHPMNVFQEKQQKAAEEAERKMAEERRKAVEAAEAEDQHRWNSYPWQTPKTQEHTAAFRANCQFDRTEAQKYWAERKGLVVCRDTAVVYFAEQNVPFTREEFDWVMDDLHAGHEYRKAALRW